MRDPSPNKKLNIQMLVATILCAVGAVWVLADTLILGSAMSLTPWLVFFTGAAYGMIVMAVALLIPLIWRS